jgi:phasin family protein
MDMFKQFGSSLNLPAPDVNDIMEYHRKNIMAMQAASQTASASAQTLMAKQREALEETLSEIAAMVMQDPTKADDPAKAMANPMEFAKKSFDATIRNTTEMAEIVKQGNMDTFNILKERMEESLKDLRAGKDSKDA